jgi:hypothetical protein
VVLRNEFASLEVDRDDSANGPRLRILDLETGTETFLDLLEVESLTRLSHDDFVEWVRPE